MVTILFGKLDAPGEKVQYRFELLQVLTASLHATDITLHAVGVDDLQHTHSSSSIEAMASSAQR